MRRAVLTVALLALAAGLTVASEDPTPPIFSYCLAPPLSFTLEIRPLLLGGKGVQLLHHRADKRLNMLLVSSFLDRSLYYSSDMGRSWTRVPDSSRWAWRAGFVTEEGNFLVWEGHEVRLLDRAGKVLATQPDAPHIWHGSEGIGQAGRTIIYAEYSVRQAEEVRVFRSQDRGRT